MVESSLSSVRGWGRGGRDEGGGKGMKERRGEGGGGDEGGEGRVGWREG